MATKEVRQKALAEIYERDGCIKPSVVVAEASAKDSPIHDEFNWNDKTAAHEHRLTQARHMIRITTYRAPSGVESKYVNVPVEVIEGPTARDGIQEGQYKPMRIVAQDENELQRSLRQLIKQRAAMDQTIRELKRVAKQQGKDLTLVNQLSEELKIVKTTLALMMKTAA